MTKQRGIWAEILRGTKFLWNKFFFFLIIGVVLFGVGNYTHPVKRLASLVNSFKVSADVEKSSNLSGIKDYQSTINVAENGTVTVDGKKSTTKVTPSGSSDELRYIVFDGEKKRPSEVIYGNVTITVNLPKAIDESKIPQSGRRLITAHGVGDTLESKFTSNKAIVFEARDVVPTAIVTVLINFPKGYLTLGTTSELQRTVWNIPGSIWLVLSIGLPLISLIVMLMIYFRTTGESLSNPPESVTNAPPDNLSPPLVGILAHGRIRAKELLAIFIDLSNRGFLGIEDRDGELMVYKKNIRSDAWGLLRPFEKKLVEELFGARKLLNTAKEIKVKDSKDLFSRKVTQVYKQLYNDVAQTGLFEKNPAAIHWRYRIYGIAVFLVGGAGFLFAMITAPDPKFTLFFWAAMIAISLVTIFFASRISARTARGKTELIKWLAFRNYLALGRPVHLEEAREFEFERFLPYAIALDVELEWAERFGAVDFRLPAWYGAANDILDVQGFSNSFFPLLGNFTEQLSFMKEPTIE